MESQPRPSVRSIDLLNDLLKLYAVDCYSTEQSGVNDPGRKRRIGIKSMQASLQLPRTRNGMSAWRFKSGGVNGRSIPPLTFIK